MGLEDIRQARIEKAEELKEKVGPVFPAKVQRDFSVSEAITGFSKLSKRKKPLHLVGRIFAVRTHGGVTFCDFKDNSSGDSFQAYLKKELVGKENFVLFEETVDIGDFVEFKGGLFKTKKGEKSIKVSSWHMISKSLRPLPEKWHGLVDVEERFRKRYLDLLMNEGVSQKFVVRSAIINETRAFLNRHGFLEVETPLLQPMAGGALAEPFRTHHNALDIDLFLRIAPELYLKRLLVGGFEKVYEIGRNFRNEGIDVTHNPEFTMLEFYQAYKDTTFAMGFVEDLIKSLAKKIFGRSVPKYGENQIIFSKKFAVVPFYDVLKRYALLNDAENLSKEDMALKARQFGIEVSPADSKEKIADNIFKKVCRPKLVQPTFVTDHPLGISPLAKKKEENPNLTDRFQLIIGGLELVNGFSELNDPLDQAERFEDQQSRRKAGDKETAEMDESYIEAMEYGMPPAVGVGIGIDRLVMFFTNTHNIREVVLFPTLRPKE